MSNATRRNLLLILGLAMVLAACDDKEPTPGDAGVEPDYCQTPECGSNTAVVNNYPIEALHLDGRPNSVGFSIIPTLYPSGTRLDIRQGEIVGVDPVAGNVVLRGRKVRNSWFRLRKVSSQAGPDEEWKVHITKVARVSLWPVGRQTEQVYAYELKVSGEGAFDTPPVCSKEWAWNSIEYNMHIEPGTWWRQIRDWLLAANAFSLDIDISLDWRTRGRFAVLIAGETYATDTGAVLLTGEQGKRWFNIACSGTALAKMKLMGYDPEEDRTTSDQRQATLRMITARYCGTQSFTRTGQALIWQNAQKGFLRDPERVGAVEALWNKDGATCLNQPRYKERDEVIQSCGKEIPTCDASIDVDSIPPGNEWGTWHVSTGEASLVRTASERRPDSTPRAAGPIR